REGAQGRRHPARPPQRRDRRELLPRGLLDRPLRGPAAHDRLGARGGPGNLRRRHPEPRRERGAARRDGVRARVDRPDVGADQPAQPAPRDEVRRPRPHGPVGRGEVDRDLPAHPARGALPPVRRARGEPRRPPAARRQGRPERRDDGELPHDARLDARARSRPVRGPRAQRRPPRGQRREPAAGQPLGLARRRDARRGRGVPRHARAGRGGGHRDPDVGPGDPAAVPEEEGGPGAPRRRAEPVAGREARGARPALRHAVRAL
ncbi:MAG: Biotin synthase, partial [uncultured Solirubrobacteraceae bacterium]